MTHKTDDQQRAEAWIQRLVNGPSASRADEVLGALTKPAKPPQSHQPPDVRRNRSLVEETGTNGGPQMGGKPEVRKR
jgi:hypothetical protein